MEKNMDEEVSILLELLDIVNILVLKLNVLFYP